MSSTPPLYDSYLSEKENYEKFGFRAKPKLIYHFERESRICLIKSQEEDSESRYYIFKVADINECKYQLIIPYHIRPTIFRIIKSDSGKYYMLMDYIASFDLWKFKPLTEKYPRSDINFYIAKIIFGSLYELLLLQSNGYIHQDISPDNIVFDVNFDPWIIDFGQVKEKISGSVAESTRISGQPKGKDKYISKYRAQNNGKFFYYEDDQLVSWAKSVLDVFFGDIKDGDPWYPIKQEIENILEFEKKDEKTKQDGINTYKRFVESIPRLINQHVRKIIPNFDEFQSFLSHVCNNSEFSFRKIEEDSLTNFYIDKNETERRIERGFVLGTQENINKLIKICSNTNLPSGVTDMLDRLAEK